jgi:uncharacterized membrane protein YjfL (UPF0719 family)
VGIPMSGDEVWVAFLSTAIALYTWAQLAISTAAVWSPRRGGGGRSFLWLAPLTGAGLIAVVLKTAASHDVVDDIRYLYLYFALGLAWMGIALRAFPSTGIILRDDSIERRNPAAAPALGGAIIGVAAAYAGGNIGDGPGWWIVIFAALVATIDLLVLWHLLERFARVADAITIERDVAAGWRLGGFLLATGVILGRAVAGDWTDTDGFFRDMVRVGWPVLPLLGLAIGLERMLRATVQDPHPDVPTSGWLPAAGMVALAAAHIAWFGIPR